MTITYKVNTGIMKTGKHTQTRFTDDNKQELNNLESNPIELFNALYRNKIKHTFSEIEFRDKVDINIIIKQGIRSVSFNKSVRGCFITYNITIN